MGQTEDNPARDTRQTEQLGRTQVHPAMQALSQKSVDQIFARLRAVRAANERADERKSNLQAPQAPPDSLN